MSCFVLVCFVSCVFVIFSDVFVDCVCFPCERTVALVTMPDTARLPFDFLVSAVRALVRLPGFFFDVC